MTIPESPSLNTQLANAVAAIASAQDAHEVLKHKLALAQRGETDALNRLNEAQKHFDDLVAEVRKRAPRESDWKRSDSRGMAT